VAAAGIVALEQMVDRLAEDHANARRLAEGLDRLPDLSVDVESVETNIVVLQLDGRRVDARRFVGALAERGVRVGAAAGGRMRLVTHYQVTCDDVDHVLKAAEAALGLVTV
jgi:threonine aldolase